MTQTVKGTCVPIEYLVLGPIENNVYIVDDGAGCFVVDPSCHANRILDAIGGRKVDAIVMTGGVSNDEDFIANVKKYAGWVAPFIVYGGDFEMEALASGAIRALTGEEETKEYRTV